MNPDQNLGPNSMGEQQSNVQNLQDVSIYEDSGIISQDNYSQGMQQNFYENLANILPDNILMKIAENLLDALDEDLDSRERWSSRLKSGLSLLGTEVEIKTFPFDGATGVYSAALMQSAISFVSIAKSELLPPAGPCRTAVLGEETPELEDQALRTEQFTNYFLTQVSSDFYPEMEKACLWAFLAGFSVVKVYLHPILNRPTLDRIMPQDFIVAQNTKSLDTSPRLTQILYLTKKEIRERQLSGFYKDIKLNPSDTLESDEDDIQAEVDRIEGVSHDSLEFDDQFILYECHADIDIEGLEHTDNTGKSTGIPLPYIVTIDKESRKILSIYRNWEETDPHFKRINYFVDFVYQPGLDFYGWGMLQIAGGCAQAATTLTRQAMDGLTLNNFPGGVRVKGMRLQENSVRVGPTEFVEIDTGGLPINQAIMPMPYSAPSPMTLELKKQFEDNIQQLSAISNIKMDDLSPNMPVGTIYALIEQSSKPQSAIMQRFHGSMGRLLRIVFRLFGQSLPEVPYFFKSYGSQAAVMRQDFNESIDIIPVSDPNMSSSIQRLVRSEAILKLAQGAPQLHNLPEIYKRIYRAMNVENVDEVLVKPQEILPLDPITENANMIKGQGAKAGLDQDHAAHMETHSFLISDPSMAQNSPHMIPIVQAHIQEHLAMKYQIEMMQRTGINITPELTQAVPDIQNQIATAAAQATQQMVQEAQQALAQQKPPAPDPTQLVIADMQQRAQESEARMQMERAKNESNLQVKMKELELKEREFHLRTQEMEQDFNLKLQTLQQKMETDRLNRETELAKESLKREIQSPPELNNFIAP